MAPDTSVKAEVSVRVSGEIYVGVKACDMLGVGYNDRVRVTIKRENLSDVEVTGYLDSSNHFYVGEGETARIAGGFEESTVSREQAIIEEAHGTWEDSHELTDSRYDNCETLASKL